MSLLSDGKDYAKGIDGFDYKSPTFNPARADNDAMLYGIEQERSFLQSAGYFVGGVAVQTLDTFMSALPGISNDYVDNVVKTQAPDFASFMQDHEGAIGLTADILGSFIPAGLAIKTVRSARVAEQLGGKIFGTGLDRVLSSGMANSRLFKPVFNEARKVIKEGKAIHNLENVEQLKVLQKKFINQSVKDVLVENVAADIAVYTTMRNSNTMFSEESTMVENLAFFGGFNIAFGIGARIAAKHAMARGLNEVAREVKGQVVNPRNISVYQVSKAGERGFVAASAQMLADDYSNVLKTTGLDPEVETTFSTMRASAKKVMAEEFDKAASDAVIPGVTESFKLTSEQKRTLQDVGDISGADSFIGLRSLEPLTPEKEINQNLTTRILKDKFELAEKQKRLDIKNKKLSQDVGTEDFLAARGPKHEKLAKEVADLEARVHENLRTSSVVYEIDGTVSPLSSRKEMFQDGPRDIGTLVDGRKSVKADDKEFLVSRSGAVEFPSEIVDLAKTATVSDISIKPVDIFKSLDTTERGLVKTMRQLGGEAALETTVAVKELRNSLPETFTAFIKDDGDVIFSMTKTGKFKTPVTLSREDVFGMTEKGKNLIANPRKFVNASHDVFSKLTYKQKTAVYDGLRAARDSFNINTVDEIPVSQAMHHTQLDYVISLLDSEVGGEAFKKISSPYQQKETLRRELEWASLRAKFTDFQKIQEEELKAFKEANKFGKDFEFSSFDDYARMLNLPTGDDAILQIFQRFRTENRIMKLESFFPDTYAFKQAVGTVFDRGPGIEQQYIGNMLTLSTRKKPIVGLVKNLEPMQGSVTREHLMEQELHDRALQLDILKKSASSPDGFNSVIASLVGEETAAMPELMKTIKQTSMDLVQGAQSYGLLGKNFQSQAFKARLNPSTEAVGRYAGFIDRAIQSKGIERLLAPHRDVFRALMDRGNEGDFAAYSVVKNAMMGGWDVKAKPLIKNEEGKKIVQYVLEQNDRNRDFWRTMARNYWKGVPEEMPQDALLPMSKLDPRPATATPLAHATLESIDKLEQQKLTEYNVLRQMDNRPNRPRRTWHMPVPDANAQNVAFVLSSDGKVVQAVAGATKAEAEKLAKVEAKNWAAAGIKVRVGTEESIGVYKRAYGDLYEEMRSFARPDLQTGQGHGAYSAPTVITDPRHLKADIESILADFNSIGRSTRMKLLEPELRNIEFQKDSAMLTGAFGKQSSDTVFDDWKFAALGVQRLDDTSILGKGLLAVENGYNRAMQHWYDARWGSRQKPTMWQERRAKKQFEGLQAALPEKYLPASSYTEYLEKTQQVSIPQNMRRNMAAINEITAAVAIRMFDVGMGMINTLSLVTTLPPVMMALQKQKGEDVLSQMRRIGVYADATPKGIAKLNPVKTAISATHWAYGTDEGRAFAAFAREKGLFEQAAAEQIDLYSRTGEQFVSRQLRDLAKVTSGITDWTETFAREYSFMNFGYIGKNVLGLDDHAAALFAHTQANNVIADFRPSNRPLIFQGAAGMPIGLFTTYMWNYLQRMYSMIETGSTKLLGAQVALQTAFFGAESVPGVNEYIDLFTSNYDGSRNLVDTLNEKMGHEAASFLLNGSVASLTGLSVGPRAGIGIPGTRFNPLDTNFYAEAAPAFTMAKRVANVFGETFDNWSETGQFDPTFLASAWARANINKGTSNMIELAQGYSEDAKGNMIEEHINAQAITETGTYARIFGFKPFYADEFRQENRRNSMIDAKRAELKNRLAMELRHHARQGTLGLVEVEQALENYVRAGGQPGEFMRFFKSQAVKGATAKIDLEIAQALKASYDDGRIARLLAIMEP